MWGNAPLPHSQFLAVCSFHSYYCFCSFFAWKNVLLLVKNQQIQHTTTWVLLFLFLFHFTVPHALVKSVKIWWRGIDRHVL